MGEKEAFSRTPCCWRLRNCSKIRIYSPDRGHVLTRRRSTLQRSCTTTHSTRMKKFSTENRTSPCSAHLVCSRIRCLGHSSPRSHILHLWGTALAEFSISESLL